MVYNCYKLTLELFFLEKIIFYNQLNLLSLIKKVLKKNNVKKKLKIDIYSISNENESLKSSLTTFKSLGLSFDTVTLSSIFMRYSASTISP